MIGKLDFFVLSVNVLNRLMKLICEVRALNWLDREILTAVLRGFRRLASKNHLRMVNKIAVDGKSIGIFPEVHPFRLSDLWSVTLF